MTIIIPMAGLGSRFPRAEWLLPKPLISVCGEPMYRWAVRSLRPLPNESLIFVIRADEFEMALRADILATFTGQNVRIVSLNHGTNGQAETVLCARRLVDPDEPLIIHNADTAFLCERRVDDIGHEWDGALMVFLSTEARWSYANTVPNDVIITEVREKMVVSPYASTGTYYFRRAGDFFSVATEAIAAAQVEQGEYYVGPMYNRLIERGSRFRTVEASEVYCFGTPEDLANCSDHFSTVGDSLR